MGVKLANFVLLAFGLSRSSFGGLMLPIVPGDLGGPADFSTGQIETVVDADGVVEVWVTFSPLQVDGPDDSTPFTSSVTLAWNVPVSSVFVSEQVAGSSLGGYERGPEEWDWPRAGTLGVLAARDLKSGAALTDREAIHRLQPAYMRVSEAERRFRAATARKDS